MGKLDHLGHYFNIETSFPYGRDSNDVIAVAVDEDMKIYTWYSNRTVASGDRYDLDRYMPAVAFELPPGKKVSDIIGAAAVKGQPGRFYFWYKDLTYSVGYDAYLDTFVEPQPFTLPLDYRIDDVVAISTNKDDGKIYTWFKDGAYTVGLPFNLSYYQGPKPYVIQQGLGDVTGAAFWGNSLSMVSFHRSERVYRLSYSLGEPKHLDTFTGLRHAVLPDGFSPEEIVAMALLREGHSDVVVTWYDNNFFSKGTFTDLGYYGVDQYDTDIGNIEEILGIGINKEGMTHTLFKTGEYAIGEIGNLSAYFYDQGFQPADGRWTLSVIAVGVQDDVTKDSDSLHVWYNDNGGSMPIEYSVGPYWNLGREIGTTACLWPESKRSDDIVGIALGQQDLTATYYKPY
ncbi:hypothetical protein [Litoribrevibacter albus]|uniref:Uncharacterized protein n=1 Tax=Litoribrevibacter albus TaxID=1473156 RepID=A0AA37W8P4_9GAMM|nr:hypothetical protein [Litoribrevibacter albus]GLQ31766.1 hypothetical protein GCM10007876_22450 [Litoribrevibacter albus]